MKSIKEYSIEEESFIKASVFGIFLIAFWIVVRYILEINISIYTNPMDVIGLALIQLILYFSTWLLIIISAIWTYRIAKKQNRNAGTLALIALIFPAITIIVVGFLKEVINSNEINDIVDKTRDKYNQEYGRLINNHNISKEEKKLRIKKLTDQYDLILQRNLMELKVNELIEQITLMKEREEIDFPVDIEKQRDILLTDLSNNLYMKNIGSPYCPACNASIQEESVICSECELILK